MGSAYELLSRLLFQKWLCIAVVYHIHKRPVSDFVQGRQRACTASFLFAVVRGNSLLIVGIAVNFDSVGEFNKRALFVAQVPIISNSQIDLAANFTGSTCTLLT